MKKAIQLRFGKRQWKVSELIDSLGKPVAFQTEFMISSANNR